MTSGPRFEVVVRPPRASGGRIRLAADVCSPALGARELWYEVDETSAASVTDRGDPFVIATLVLAMVEGCDVIVRGALLDRALHRNLAEFQRIWNAWFGYEPVGIDAETTGSTVPPSDRGVVAFSGGADSAFSAWWHTRGEAASERALGAAMMLHGVDIPLTDPVGFTSAAARSRHMAESVGLDLVVVATNAWDFPVPIGHYTGMGVAAGLHVLAGGFGAGLVPSTATYADLVVPLNSSPVSDGLLGGGAFVIEHDGARFNRLEKLRTLATWPEAMTSLRVCLVDERHDRNCGACTKCMITLAALHVLGVAPRCFERVPDAAELARWAPTMPTAPYYLQEGTFIVEAADARGLDEPWVRALRRRIRTARAKQGVRGVFPGFADAVAAQHRRANRLLRRAQRRLHGGLNRR